MSRGGKPEGFDEALLEESLDDLYEHAPCGYVSTFPDGSFAKVNQTFLDWTGYGRDELLAGRRFQELLTVGGRIFYETHLTPLLHMQGFVNEIALDLVCHDGRRLSALINSVQRRDASGAPLLHRTTIFDVSSRRAYERELLLARRQAEQAAERLAHLLAAASALVEALTPAQAAQIITTQSITALDAQAGLIALVADDGASLELIYAAGYPPDALEGWERFSLDTQVPFAEAARTGEPILLGSPAALANRYPRLVAMPAHTGNLGVAAVPLSIDGRVIGVLGLSFAFERDFPDDDRTFLLTLARQCALALEHARLYEAERSARTEAQEALHVRDAFLSIASHELKNPLTSLLGNAQLLHRRFVRSGNQSERDQNTLAAIVAQADRLNKLITTLLDVSQMQPGQLRVERKLLDLCALVRRIAVDIQPTLAGHTLALSDPRVALTISGDPLRLEQVFQNLLQNAIKYSPKGGLIAVRVEHQGQMACVAISDQGIGIPQEALPQLFQRFYRAANVEAEGVGGLGIGLYVVKEIVTLHGGTVDVASTEHQGSTFTVCLPLAIGAQPIEGRA